MIRKRAFLLLLTVGSFIYFSSIVLAQTYTYREDTSGKKLLVEYKIEPYKKGYKVVRNDKRDQQIEILDGQYKTREYHYKSKILTANYSVVRENGSLRLTGKYNSKVLKKKIPIDRNNWQQTFFGYNSFVSTSKEKLLFWVLSSDPADPQNVEAVKLVIKKGKKEKVKVNGKVYDTQKIIFTLPDWRSVFWSSYYWYRVEDGVLVKYVERRGGPGAPDSIGLLINEK